VTRILRVPFTQVTVLNAFRGDTVTLFLTGIVAGALNETSIFWLEYVNPDALRVSQVPSLETVDTATEVLPVAESVTETVAEMVPLVDPYRHCAVWLRRTKEYLPRFSSPLVSK
jgi:hypothetical protein